MKENTKIDMVNMSITNKCILKCPSCPTGRLNMRNEQNSRANKLEYTSLETCDKIFSKIFKLYGQQLIYLHIWNEPLIHPNIVEVLKILDRYKHKAYLSSNINAYTDWKSLLEEPALKTLVISISGATQETYKKGHRGGNINVVLKNLDKINNYSVNSSANIVINFHKYTDNNSDEEKIRTLCKGSKINFAPYPAVVLQENIADNVLNGRFEEWRNIKDISDLVIPRISKHPFPFTKITRLENIPCHSQTNILVLDHEGQICTCTHQEPSSVRRLGNFLELSEYEIMHLKATTPSCAICRELGLHMQYVFACFFEKPCASEQMIVDFLSQVTPHTDFANTKLYVFGAGMTGGAVAPLLKHHGYNILGFIDDNPNKVGTYLHGIPIYSIDQVTPLLENAWVLDTVRSFPFQQKASNAGISCGKILSAEDFIALVMK